MYRHLPDQITKLDVIMVRTHLYRFLPKEMSNYISYNFCRAATDICITTSGAGKHVALSQFLFIGFTKEVKRYINETLPVITNY